MAYGVDGLRAAFIGLSEIGVATDLVVLTGVATLFLVMGARAFARIQV
jgi:ABC-2 type transport system permease protein